MERKMTSWTLNLVLAGMTAAAVFLPPPDEIRKAIEYGRVNHPIQIKAVPDEPEIVIQNTSATGAGATSVVSYAPAVNCLERIKGEPIDRLSNCIPDLFDKVENFDRISAAQVALGRDIYPDPQIEQARSALIKLCRAAWSADLPGAIGTDPQDCRTLMVGVDY